MEDLYKHWIHLAQAHVFLGQQNIACDLLNKASELHPESWEILRDLCVLSGYCQNYEKMIISYNMLLDIRKSYVNMNILINLAKGVADKSCSSCGTVGLNLRREALYLFERLLKREPHNSGLWALFGLVTAHAENITGDVRRETVERLSRALETATPKDIWWNNYSKIIIVLCNSQIIGDVFIIVCKYFKNTPDREYLLKIGSIFIKKTIEKILEHQTDVVLGLTKREYLPNILALQEKLIYLEKISKE